MVDSVINLGFHRFNSLSGCEHKWWVDHSISVYYEVFFSSKLLRGFAESEKNFSQAIKEQLVEKLRWEDN